MQQHIPAVGVGCCLLAGLLAGAADAQQSDQTQTKNTSPTFQIRSNLVLVPALVRKASGELVYSLRADDFSVKDNGVEQKITLESDVQARPLALVIVLQANGNGIRQQEYLSGLSTMVDNIAGNVSHRVALVTFGSLPSMTVEFSKTLDPIIEKLKHLPPSDGGSAILDAVDFSLLLLEEQPKEYRRAILLISETRDHGSKTSQKHVIRSIGESNTAIYSVAFSPAKTQFKDALTGPGGSNPPYNLSVFFPPVVAYFNLKPLLDMAINGMERNTAEEMASLSGGEYIRFDNKKEFDGDLNQVANHLPNRYLLSFQPSDPKPGLHVIEVRVKNHPEWTVMSRTFYWAAGDVASSNQHEP
jgi:VWFA-related protein